MQKMMSPEMFKERFDGYDLYKLELEKNRLENEINNNPTLNKETKNIYNLYLKQLNELLVKELNNVTNREPFKLSQLKYTKYHLRSRAIANGDPITTSIEIKPEMVSNKWEVNIIHKYILEDNLEEKVINKVYDLPNQEVILNLLEENDLRYLKNNYFSDEVVQKYSHWELQYNNYFKISGTFDQEPEQVKKIITILNCESIINEALSKVAEILNKVK